MKDEAKEILRIQNIVMQPAGNTSDAVEIKLSSLKDGQIPLLKLVIYVEDAMEMATYEIKSKCSCIQRKDQWI